MDKNKSKNRLPKLFHIFRGTIYRSSEFLKHEELQQCSWLLAHGETGDRCLSSLALGTVWTLEWLFNYSLHRMYFLWCHVLNWKMNK